VKQPVFHSDSDVVLRQLQQRLPQSLLLSGPKGIGTSTAARWLAGHELVEYLQPYDTKGQPKASGTISVEAIRNLYEQTRNRSQAKQIIIIDNAERMSSGASAAFLKLLEEPGKSIHFILTSHSPQALLPTIISRVQHATLRPMTTEQTRQFITDLGINDPTKIAQLEFLASGLPAELSRLAKDDSVFAENAKIIGDARTFLQATAYKKLLIVHEYRQDRARALQLVDAALTILRRSLSAQPQSGVVTHIQQLLEVREKIAANGNTSLQLATFVI
jgi:DNA polymerase-3 subunit delta'